MKYVHFYATASDILSVLRQMEAGESIKYVPTGKRAEINRPIYLTCDEIPDLRPSYRETDSISVTYMVSQQEIKNVVYELRNNEGQRRWLLSNGDNPDSVLLTLGGLQKSGTLLPGNMSTLHENTTAQRLMKHFRSAVKAARFVKYGAYWFGPEAIEMLKAGRRLTQSEQSPPSFDVPPPERWETRQGSGRR